MASSFSTQARTLMTSSASDADCTASEDVQQLSPAQLSMITLRSLSRHRGVAGGLERP